MLGSPLSPVWSGVFGLRQDRASCGERDLDTQERNHRFQMGKPKVKSPRNVKKNTLDQLPFANVNICYVTGRGRCCGFLRPVAVRSGER